MKNKIYRFTHWAAYLTILHGLFYFIVKYFFQVESEYGARPHWSQTYLQSTHVLLSPLFLFAFGMLWNSHIVVKFKNSRLKRFSGLSLLATCLIMVISGYGVQAFYEESSKAFNVWAHLVTGLLFVVVYPLHHFRKR